MERLHSALARLCSNSVGQTWFSVGPACFACQNWDPENTDINKHLSCQRDGSKRALTPYPVSGAELYPVPGLSTAITHITSRRGALVQTGVNSRS